MPKSSQNRSQNHQKSFQNRPLDPPRNPTWTKVAFETPYFPLSGSKRVPNGTPKSIKNRSFFRPVFEWLFGTTFSCFWPPFGLPKRPQNETQKGAKTRTRKTSMLSLFTTLEPHWGVLKIIIFDVFLGTFLRYLFETSFSSILDPFGDPFGTLWAPKKHPKKHTKKRHQKRAIL